jgi:putative nucleotidyltransferase with HDIG domain
MLNNLYYEEEGYLMDMLSHKEMLISLAQSLKVNLYIWDSRNKLVSKLGKFAAREPNFDALRSPQIQNDGILYQDISSLKYFFFFAVVIENQVIAYLGSDPFVLNFPLKKGLEIKSVNVNLTSTEKTTRLDKKKLRLGYHTLTFIKYTFEALCMEKNRSLRNLSMLHTMYDIRTSLVSNLSLQEILQNLLSTAINLLEAHNGSLMLINEERNELQIVAAVGLSEEIIKQAHIKLGEGIAGEVARSGKARLVPKNYRESSYLKEGAKLESSLSVPLISNETPIGVLNISGKLSGGDFTNEDMRFLKALADHAALAIENGKLYNNLKQKIAELSLLLDTSNALNASLNRKEVFQEALNRAIEVLKAENGSLMLLDEESQELHIEIANGLPEEVINNTRIKLGSGIAGKVALTGQARLLLKGIKEVDSQSLKQAVELKSALCVPMKIMDKVVGVFNISGKREGDNFTSDDLQLLILLANQAAIAIENTELHHNLQELFINSIKALANAIDARDPYTRGHSERVTEYAVKIAEKMNLDKMEIEFIRYAGLLHDIGKIKISDALLRKPEKLTEEEFIIIKKHPAYGASIMEPVKEFKKILPYMYHHHEAYGSGGGYPSGLHGEEIPLAARILAVADSFDAMTSDRPYRKALPLEVAISELRKFSGVQFDPEVAEVFIQMLENKEIEVVYHNDDKVKAGA